jgi:hypothetical protein
MSATTIALPKIAGSFGNRDNATDLEPRRIGERHPRDADGTGATPGAMGAREDWIQKMIQMIFVRPSIPTPQNVVAALVAARKVAVEAFDLSRGLSMAETPGEISAREMREKFAKVAGEVPARMAQARAEVAAMVAKIKKEKPMLPNESVAAYRFRIADELDALRKIHLRGNLAPFSADAVGL